MANLAVRPAPTGWAVVVSGRRVGTKPTKAAAIKAARRKGSRGDNLEIHRSDGTFQRYVTLRS